MKFVYEKFDAKFIERKVREEQARTGKRVLQVKLNPSEWHAFMCDMEGYNRHYYGGQFPPTYKIALHQPMNYMVRPDEQVLMSDTVNVVEIVRE